MMAEDDNDAIGAPKKWARPFKISYPHTRSGGNLPDHQKSGSRDGLTSRFSEHFAKGSFLSLFHLAVKRAVSMKRLDMKPLSL